MKKMISIFAVLALTLCMSTTVFAESNIIDDYTPAADINVKAKYVPGDPAIIVCSVDVAWGNMQFTYNEAGEGIWNPGTHEYNTATPAGWSCAWDANKITVTNHSNTGLTVLMSYAQGAGYEGITGSLTNESISLDTAEGTEIEDAPSGSSLLTLSGTLASTVTTPTQVGTVTVTLS